MTGNTCVYKTGDGACLWEHVAHIGGHLCSRERNGCFSCQFSPRNFTCIDFDSCPRRNTTTTLPDGVIMLAGGLEGVEPPPACTMPKSCGTCKHWRNDKNYLPGSRTKVGKCTSSHWFSETIYMGANNHCYKWAARDIEVVPEITNLCDAIAAAVRNHAPSAVAIEPHDETCGVVYGLRTDGRHA